MYSTRSVVFDLQQAFALDHWVDNTQLALDLSLLSFDTHVLCTALSPLFN
jgi:hypothetical protein